jgi:hypothetical protein
MSREMSVDDKHILHALTGTDDPGRVSKMTLVKCVTMLMTERSTLYRELFCENPEHPLFGNLTEVQLAPLRKERLIRRP